MVVRVVHRPSRSPSTLAATEIRLRRHVRPFFGDRPILYDAAEGSASADDLRVLGRLFTYEPLALALARDDEDFRLVVDRSLSGLFRSGAFKDVYVKWFGEPDDSAAIFFGLSALPE